MTRNVAVMEISFNPDSMIDQETLDKDFNGDLLEAMKWLYHNEGMGMFNTEAHSEIVGIKAYKS